MSFKNKKAYYDFEIIEEFDAGIVLEGNEVKSLRNGKASIIGAFCVIRNEEIFLRDSLISEYSKHYSHDPKRERKLLMLKREIKRLKRSIEEKGLSIVPLILKTNDRGIFKLTIALARGKKNHDKRASLKEKDIERTLSRF